MSHLKTLAPVVFVSVFSSACVTPQPSARTIEVEFGKAGVIAIPHSGDSRSREMAAKMMAENCGAKKATVFKESEAITGQLYYDDPLWYGGGAYRRGRSHTSMMFAPFPPVVKNSTEWHLHYRCE